jgi:hypothetical protein
MPYKVFRNDDGKHCLHKLNADDSMGELINCHDTAEEARAQQRALYASEAKETTDATLDLIKEITNDDKEDKPERVSALLDEWKARIKLIPEESEEEEPEEEEPEEDSELLTEACKKPRKKDLLSKLKEIGESIKSWFKGEENDDTGLSIWKEGNQYFWLARYSNNFRDQDNPPEIISSDSHKRFVSLVKEGKAPLPELWLWHKKEWKVGQTLSLAYDDVGFAVAIGSFDLDKSEIAMALMKSKDIRVSHGMPKSSIQRDSSDPTVIMEHETREISPLPAWAAANKLTGFAVLNLESKEDTMIPDETKKEWISNLGINPETLSNLEAANAKDADKAVSEGLESKDATQPVVEVAEPTFEAPTLEQLRTAVQEAVQGIVNPVIERISTIEASLKQLKESSDSRDEVLKGTPTASLSALLGQFAQSAIGPETRVDGRTSLAQSKPKETESGRTGIPFIDSMLGQ